MMGRLRDITENLLLEEQTGLFGRNVCHRK
jgi:hypothetical protein